MKSFIQYFRSIIVPNNCAKNRTPNSSWYRVLTSGLVSSAILTGTSLCLFAPSAIAAPPTRRDWCGTLWSVENLSQLAWINPIAGANPAGTTTTTSGPTPNITMPGGSMGTSVAAIGIHKESGTMYAFDRIGTGTLYKYQFGVDSAWVAVPVSGLIGAAVAPTIPGASNNLNKMSIDGDVLFLAESNGIAVYAVPLNASGVVTGSAAVKTYTFVGDPAGTPAHRSLTNTDPIGTYAINGGDLATDEYGDVYNITYNVKVVDYVLVGYDAFGNPQYNQVTATDQAYFYKQDPVAKTWIYQGQTSGNASFAGAAFYRGDLYVKSGQQLKKVDLTRSVSGGYTGWSNPLLNIGSPSTTSSGDLASCGTPIVNMTKTQQIYTDAALTTLAPNPNKVRTGQYIKYTITSQNVGDAWARSMVITDNLPTGTTYVPNSAELNGTSLNLTTYPTLFTVNSPGIGAGIIRYPTDPDTAILSFAVQVTATSGAIQNRATSAYVDVDGLTELANCNVTPQIGCSDAPPATVTYGITGNIFNDLNSNKLQAASGENYTRGDITVVLLNASNQVVSTTVVDATGAYLLNYVAPGTYTVKIIQTPTTALTIGAVIPSAQDILPLNWAATGENNNGVIDGTVDRKLAVTVTNTSIAGINFGIKNPAGPTFACDGTLYQALNDTSEFKIINTTTQTLDPAFVTTPAKYINALGFNVQDGYVYGLSSTLGGTSGDGNIYRIGSNGQIVNLGNPIGTTSPVAGDVGADGTYYVLHQNFSGTTSILYKVNVSGAVATQIGSSFNLGSSLGPVPDIAYNPIDGMLYGANKTGEIVQINPSTGALKFLATSVSIGVNSKGAVYFDAFGNFYAYDNTGILYKYQLNLATLTATGKAFATGPSVTFNDGFSCPYQVRLEKTVVGSGTSADGTASIKAGNNVTYTYKIANPNTVSISGVTLADTMANGRTYLGGTLTNSLGGTPNAYGGTNGLSVAGLTLPPRSTSNITVQVKIPIGTSASRLYNQATLTGFPIGFGGPSTISDYPPTGILGDATPLDVTANNSANLVLIKRITAINGVRTINPSDNTTPLNSILDNPATPNDDAGVQWPANYLYGAFDAGKIKPGDEIEYTVYFLNNRGANAKTVKICDRIIGNQTYKPGSLQLELGTASTPTGLSDANDGLDRSQFHSLSSSASASCNLITPGAGVADNGAWEIDITGATTTNQPALTNIPSATAAGVPNTSYGLIRFKTIVKP